MIEETAKKEELPILLNVLDEPLEVTYPTANLPLFESRRTRSGYSLSQTCTRDSLEALSTSSDELKSEVPDYGDMIECLLSSDVIKHSNIDYLKRNINVGQGFGKRRTFSPDTNILYHRFISNSTLIDPRDVVLVGAIRDEIEASLNHKYTPEQIVAMKRTLPYNRLLIEELMNRRMKESRKAACLAKIEYQWLRRGGIEIESYEKPTANTEENDRIIARTLTKHNKENNSNVVMLTADKSMTDLCEMEGLECFYLETPKKIGPEIPDLNARQMRSFLFNLAGVLGFVKMNSVIIFGEFKGKKDPEEIKLRFLDEKVFNEFSRHLKICRDLMKLGITQ